ncbi:MAG: YhbY family RNA-binding protein, partial [Acidovorax defluvii]
MSQIQLTPAERREHRANAHHLDPVVLVGGDGLTPAVQKEIDAALNAHGLIKVRIFNDDRAARELIYQ